MVDNLLYKRVLLKVSGEALMGKQTFGIDPEMVDHICGDVCDGIKQGAEIALVVGGGNIFRGVSLAAQGADRVSADQMGMLATVMNAIALRMGFEKIGVESVVISAIDMPDLCEKFTQRGAMAHLKAGRVVIFAAGLGHPFLTTDTGAAMRAAEIGADALMKATQVDGIYSADPRKDKNAVRFDHIDHDEIISRGLNVMDIAAISLTRENNIPIVVFSIHEKDQLVNILQGKGRFTLVQDR